MAFLFNTLVMVIVYTSIKNIFFNYQQQGNLTFMLQNLCLSLIYLTYAQKDVFSYFSFIRLIQFALL
jgi:hypothetical protein